MTDSAFLSQADVVRITRRKRWKAQCEALAAAGIPFRRAGAHGDGEPLVRRDALDESGKPAQRRPSHSWDRIGGVVRLRT